MGSTKLCAGTSVTVSLKSTLQIFESSSKSYTKQSNSLRPNSQKNSMPLGHFLSQTYSGEGILSDRLKPSERQLMVLQNTWRDRVGITAIKETLETMIRNIQAAQSLLGNNKPRQHQVKTFVLSLARVWNETTGHCPKSGRDPDSFKQSGPFADFVRETNNILPESLRIHTFDRAIRSVCESSNCP